MSAVKFIREQMIVTRDYTDRLLSSVPDERWLEIPAGGVSNLVWQAGHIAVAAYRLGLARIRDPHPGDEAILPARFVDLYGKGTNPSADPGQNETPSRIRASLEAIQRQVFHESQHWSEEELDGECLLPHPIFSKKIDSLWWYARHEAIHAGQIGLIRRMLGYDPAW